jgi:glutathione S-transferase
VVRNRRFALPAFDGKRDKVAEVTDVYHIALPADWAAALDVGEYRTSSRGVTLEDEGFIHCSYQHQVGATANRFYGDLTDLVLLRIDPAKLGAPVVEEPPVPGADLFPHVYGPIPVDAVVEAVPWRRDDDDHWRL